MPHSPSTFDAVGLVVDWIDACRQHRLGDLLELYDTDARVDCCDGGSFNGPKELRRYWQPRLLNQVPGAFEIDEILPASNHVELNYRDCDGQPVRTRFEFSAAGKIVRTSCGHHRTDGPPSAVENCG
jgi:SnoaL-like protein